MAYPAYNSIRQNQEYMGYNALSGLARESSNQPRYSYSRNPHRIQQWQQSAKIKGKFQEELIKYIWTTFNSLIHCFIYIISPKIGLLINKIKSFISHFDPCHLLLGLGAIILILIVYGARFIVDYDELNTNKQQQQQQHVQQQNIEHNDYNHNVTDSNDITMDYNHNSHFVHVDINLNDHDELITETEDISDLFKPTPIKIVSFPHQDDVDENKIDDKNTVFNTWMTLNSINWNDDSVQQGQIIKLEESKNDIWNARIIQIDRDFMQIKIKYVDCWWLGCHKTLDIATSNKLIFLIKNTDIKKAEKVKEEEIESEEPDSDVEDVNDDDDDGDDDEDEADSFDPSQLFQAIEKMNDNQNDLRQWVEHQVTTIQETVKEDENHKQVVAAKQNDELQDVLTGYLDDKMNAMMKLLEQQQLTIQSIVSTQQQFSSNTSSPITTTNSNGDRNGINWDWGSVEDKIDNKIENVVKEQLEERFDNLAQQIAQEISKIHPDDKSNNNNNNGYLMDDENDDIIRENDDEWELKKRRNRKRTDWSYRVIAHSKLMKNSHDIFHIYGYWIIENVLSSWNQQSISSSYKPGDCTPLQFNQNNKNEKPFITIELYRNVHIKQVSLYHYHSEILTQTAINAAPKNFQIWASHNLTKWYDLGNFTYDYYQEKSTQYFDVLDLMNAEKNKDVDEDEGNVLLDDYDDDEDENDEIINNTSIINMNNGYDDYQFGFKYIGFRLLSNYGGSNYGCIYRIKVFGDIVS